MEQEEVILVNERDEPIGRMEKIEAHRQARLHRAFSIFIFNTAGKMLLQQRAREKYHSSGLWTNACCSHPRPGEDTEKAAARRLEEELGFTTGLQKLFEFTYRSEFDNGLTEFEFDHVYIGVYDRPFNPNPSEVAAWEYKDPGEIGSEMLTNPGKYTTWFRLAFPRVMARMGKT